MNNTQLLKGQLSYLILSCLEKKDMYGLELIEEIKACSGVEVKLPSLYSNLNRMKELKFISSYLKESTKGPKCAYSSITEQGRAELVRLKDEFGEVKFPQKEEVKTVEIQTSFDDYSDFFNEIPTDEPVKEQPKPVQSKNDAVFLKQDEPIQKEAVVEEKPEEKPSENVIENTMEEKIDEPTETPEEYNKRVFDVSRDYARFRKKKSFSENQLEMKVEETSSEEDESKKQRLAENISSIKDAIKRSKEGNYEEATFFARVNSPKKEQKAPEPKTESADLVDDGVFITDRVDYIPKIKRFDPPKITLLVTSEPEKPLPAPKRDTNLDPNCSDVKAKIESLYKKAEEAPIKTSEKIEENFTSYEELKEYYSSQNVSFKVYKRPEKRSLHNTNKLNFYVDLITFGLLAVGSAILYLIFSQVGLTNPNTNFLYYLLPILFFIYLGVRFYYYKKMVSKVPRPLFNGVIIIGATVLLSGVIFCLNLACGMPVNNMMSCATTIFLPIYVAVILLIVRHYLMLFTLKKYWK